MLMSIVTLSSNMMSARRTVAFNPPYITAYYMPPYSAIIFTFSFDRGLHYTCISVGNEISASTEYFRENNLDENFARNFELSFCRIL